MITFRIIFFMSLVGLNFKNLVNILEQDVQFFNLSDVSYNFDSIYMKYAIYCLISTSLDTKNMNIQQCLTYQREKKVIIAYSIVCTLQLRINIRNCYVRCCQMPPRHLRAQLSSNADEMLPSVFWTDNPYTGPVLTAPCPNASDIGSFFQHILHLKQSS